MGLAMSPKLTPSGATGVQTNRWIECHRPTSYGNFRPVDVECHDNLPGEPIWACRWTRTHIFEIAGQIFSVRNSMEFSGLVVVQHHVICPCDTCRLAHCCLFNPCGIAHWPKLEPLKLLDGLPLFEVLWNCLDLQMGSVLCICPFYTHGLPMDQSTYLWNNWTEFSWFQVLLNCLNPSCAAARSFDQFTRLGFSMGHSAYLANHWIYFRRSKFCGIV